MILSDKEMAQLHDKAACRAVLGCDGFVSCKECSGGCPKVAEAQHKKDIEWLEQPCPHGIGDFHDKDEPTTQCFRYACGQCWQEFKEEK